MKKRWKFTPIEYFETKKKKISSKRKTSNESTICRKFYENVNNLNGWVSQYFYTRLFTYYDVYARHLFYGLLNIFYSLHVRVVLLCVCVCITYVLPGLLIWICRDAIVYLQILNFSHYLCKVLLLLLCIWHRKKWWT